MTFSERLSLITVTACRDWDDQQYYYLENAHFKRKHILTFPEKFEQQNSAQPTSCYIVNGVLLVLKLIFNKQAGYWSDFNYF